jgi:hypothetical protein
MKFEEHIAINAPKERVWEVITDIHNSAENISGIEKIEILKEPADSLVGLKWRETRTLFGKQATEIMWITDMEEHNYYQTRAESHGSIYISRLAVADQNDGSVLTFSFDGQPQTFGAKFMAFVMGWMFKGATKKALMKDLEDIKTAVEASA